MPSTTLGFTMYPLTIIHLKGTQAEMGHQYGKLVLARDEDPERERVLTSLAFRMLKDANSHELAGRLATGFLHMVARYGLTKMEAQRPAEYLGRSRAFFEAVDYPMSFTRHALNMDVFQNIVGLAGRFGIKPLLQVAAPHVVPACSSLVVWDQHSSDGQLRHARNFDFPVIGIWEQQPTVVFCEPDEGLRYGYVDCFGADVPGTTGFNEAGLTVAAHTRFHKDVRFDGLAVVDLCHDIIRRASTIEDAISIAKERPVASTWGLMVSSAQDRKAVVLECTGRQTRPLHPPEGRDYLTCANLNRLEGLVEGQVNPFPAWSEHSDCRERRFHQRATAATLSRTDLMDALGDRSDPDSPHTQRRAGGILAQSSTVNSVVYEPEQQQMLLSLGDTPTGLGPYVEVPWDWEQPCGEAIVKEPSVIRERISWGSKASDEAYDHWRQATKVEAETHDLPAVLALIDKAIALDPDIFGYQLGAAFLRLRQGQWKAAFKHFETAEKQALSPFRKGQLLLWSARALDAMGDGAEASRRRRALLSLTGKHLEPLRANAERELKKPIAPSKLKKLVYQLDLVDASF